MTTRYWVILGHSEITERNQITTLPQKTDLVLTTTCGRVFQKNNIYERMFENDNLTYVKAFLNIYNAFKTQKRTAKSNFYNNLIRNTEIHSWNRDPANPTFFYMDQLIEMGPPEDGLIHGVYELPTDIRYSNISRTSIVNVTRKSKVRLSTILRKIHEKTGPINKAVVFGLFCRDIPGFQKEHRRNNSPIKINPTPSWRTTPFRTRTRKFWSEGLSRYKTLRPVTSRVPYFKTIESARKLKSLTKGLVYRPKSMTSIGLNSVTRRPKLKRSPVLKKRRINI